MTNIDDYVTNVLMRDLVGHDRRPVSFLVYLWLAAEEARRNGVVQISYQELAECIGVSKSVGEVADTEETSGGEQGKCDGDAALYGAESVERGKSPERRTGALSELV
jgi:hypothetical protein